ncbi:SGNH/GDSL hydrolase family protein [Lacinutrix sp. C3R15]|uniref:SGNH/GDSL hydrolase family protein n=1 Tax=Flavobacteriaceae TaxID=49546 RepID=UPI001C0A298C|nr:MULTISPECIES: SGNH/GDSL hydrolase family protein [Flavobacteriaceae]MBU2938791.1 SGNH/GDSL hydrolase family protein [Lacinutrix sp. C3R15]MDO6622104.1 SGNH/GDSL hydrolase family protein [Oceanihabitans sp. 1_MG-2023]
MQKSFLLIFTLIITYSSVYSQQESINILFIGNSLTYTNNLPQLVKTHAKQKGIEINTQMIAFPNYAIEDHWNDGQVQKLISSNKFDYVILQQGPSSQSDGRKMLIEYGKKYKSLCEINNAKLCYFMVWPSLNYYNTFDDVIKNHEDAASINNSILLPVGKVWKGYIDTYKDIDYYSADKFHPSKKGSHATAKIIVEHLLLQ